MDQLQGYNNASTSNPLQTSSTSDDQTATSSFAPAFSENSLRDGSTATLPSIPSVSVPKGGGAIHGMGDKFSTSLATGTASLSVPLATSPGRGSLGADISLDYDSGAPNGPFGLGWVLSVPSISRKTDKGLPQYRDPAGPGSDIFVITGAEDLVPELAPNPAGGPNQWSRPAPTTQTSNEVEYNVYAYRPRVEAGFVRIELWANVQAPTTDIHWRSTSPDNVLSIYGLTPNSRIVDPADPTRIFRWLLCQQNDRGNAVVIDYKAEDSTNVLATLNERNRTDLLRSSNRYIKNVFYGNITSTLVQPDLSQTQWYFQVVFDYGEHDAEVPTPTEVNPWLCRNDPFSTNKPGFEVRSYRLCQRVLMFHNFPNESNVGANCLVRSTNFAYRNDAQKGNSNITFLASASITGYQRSGSVYVSTSMPPLEFTYSDAIIDSQVQAVDLTSQENLPLGLDQSVYKWVDLDGEGLSGFLTGVVGSWFYKHNLGGGRFGPLQPLPSKPSLAQIAPGTTQHLMDLAGEGRLDVVEFGPGIQGFSKRSFEGGWEPFKPFTSLPNINWQNPNLQIVDVTGDGLADALIIEPDCLLTYESLGELGFMKERKWYPPDSSDEEKGPLLIYADQKHTVFLADMTGDGLTDLVRICNGEVCYWASQGYGQFSPKVTMLQSPWFENPDLFDPLRIRLGDIDGSGTTDVVYLTADGFVDIYLNYSGNSFGPQNRLQAFPPVDNLATVTIVDLLGKGTGCLVWSSSLPSDVSRRISYIDLVEGTKPNLLTCYVNNMGVETKLTYAPSTKFYIQDKEAGIPWITHLPFPTQVVERVEKFDYIADTYFSTRYAYHFGYFDGIEREFRGFGRVDQWDTEEYNLSSSPPANVDQASWIPPILTKTWFHTGAHIKGKQISEYFQTGYYVEPEGLSAADTAAMLLPDSVLPTSLEGNAYSMTNDEVRESVRSLKGSMLRQEVYALDGSAQQSEPYLVVEKNYTVQIFQPQRPNRYGVFFPKERERVEFHYDRNFVTVSGQQVADPRVLHTLNLAVDEWGNILQTLTVVYGRRHVDTNPQITSDDTAKQQQTLFTLGVNQYTNAVEAPDAYRTPVICDAQTFQVINLPVTTSQTFTPLIRFTDIFPTIQSLLPGTFDIPFEDWMNSTAPAGQVSRRMLGHKRIIFRADDFTGPLPSGQLQSLALPYDSYLQVLTPGLVQSIYVDSGKIAAADVESTLSNECSLVHSEGDTNWWIRAGNVFYSPNSTDTPAQEGIYAAEHFYFVRRFRDPYYSATFNTETFATLDEYDLLVVENVDPFGNRITAGERDPTDATIVILGNDYRVLAPSLVMDANRNRVAVAFDDLGRLIAQAVMGKPEQTIGDDLSTVNLRLSDADTEAYFSNPLANPAAILGSATTRIIYDTSAYYNSKSSTTSQPVRTATLNREIAQSNLAAGAQSPIQHFISYLNGSVTEIQDVSQADPDPSTQAPRWIISGWTVFDNKGHAIQKYEPFFSSSPQYQANTTVGVSKLLMYDPVGRLVATLRPDHAWSKTIFRAWSQDAWDENDTVLISNPSTDADVGSYFSRIPSTDYLPSWYDARATGALGPQQASAAAKAAICAATPAIQFFDPLGRAIVAVTENKYQRSTEASPTDVLLSSRVVFDVSGATRQVLDDNGRLVQTQNVDMLGHTIYKANMESGGTWTLQSVTTRDVSMWNSRGFRIDTSYDQAQRPTEVHLTQDTGPTALIIQTIYGESQPNPETNNLRTKIASISDQSGTKTMITYDYKGNLLNGTKGVVASYSSTVDWSASSVPLEPQTYQSSTTYDGLNRITTTTGPDGSIIRNTYGDSGLIQRIDVNLQGTTGWQSILSGMSYNAKGQRVLATTNNKVRSVYTYDALTFQMTDLVTSRNAAAFPGDCLQPPVTGWPGCQIQSLHYTFDPVGNITNIQDDAQQTIFFQNQRVEPSQTFTYDAFYRLIEATGREHLGQLGTPTPYRPPTVSDAWLQNPSNGNAMGTYNEQYFFDNVGNLQSVKHSGSDPTQPGWTRNYTYTEPSLLQAGQTSNRLSSTSVGSTTDLYSYTGNAGLTGNMTSMPHLSLMQYDYRDQLQATATQKVNSGTPETTWYAYDGGGARLRKLTVNSAAAGATPTRKSERIYLGAFEIYREFAADATAVTLERESLHVMNGTERIALIETRTNGTDNYPAQQFRYQYGNHIGSAVLELDNQAQIITYEEFYPFGSSSYQATESQTEVPKRYRYVGKELDNENGFYYYGARYYASWLGRWINCDPGGLGAGPNLYAFASNNPVVFKDPNGKEPGFWAKYGAGIMDIAGGLGEVTAGAAGVAAPTGVTQVLGGIAIVHGIDKISTGILSLMHGKEEKTLTQIGAEKAALSMHASDETAREVGSGVELAVSIVPGLAMSGIGVAKVVLARQAAKQAATKAITAASTLESAGADAEQITANLTSQASDTSASAGATASETQSTAAGASSNAPAAGAGTEPTTPTSSSSAPPETPASSTPSTPPSSPASSTSSTTSSLAGTGTSTAAQTLSPAALRIQVIEEVKQAVQGGVNDIRAAQATRDVTFLQRLGLRGGQITRALNPTDRAGIGTAIHEAAFARIRADPFLSQFVQVESVNFQFGADLRIVLPDGAFMADITTSTVAQIVGHLKRYGDAIYVFTYTW
jgi:RHS repeat-associated protein